MTKHPTPTVEELIQLATELKVSASKTRGVLAHLKRSRNLPKILRRQAF